MSRRFLDLLVAPALALLTMPLLALLALLVRFDGAPAFFLQPRLGRGGRLFTLPKLRTMRREPGAAVTAADDPRVTALGRLLRRTRLDELPQLWCVCRGEMSLVGPRPEIPELRAALGAEGEELLRFRPGLVDPATLEFLDEEDRLRGARDPESLYRNEILPRKLRRSLAYHREATLLSDLALLLRVPAALLARLSNRSSR